MLYKNYIYMYKQNEIHELLMVSTLGLSHL